jgi:hypothetical protein
VSRFHPAQLAHGEQQLLGGPLYGEAALQPESSQQGTEFAAANGRAAYFRHEGSVLSQESGAVAHNPGPMIPAFGIVPVIRAGCNLFWHLP